MKPSPTTTEAKPDGKEFLVRLTQRGLSFQQANRRESVMAFLHGLEAMGLLRSEMVRTKRGANGKPVLMRTFYPVEASASKDADQSKALAAKLREVRRLLGYVPYWAKMAGPDDGGSQMVQLAEAESIVDGILEDLASSTDESEAAKERTNG